MQPGVCSEAETKVFTGEKLDFLVETNVSRQQKRHAWLSMHCEKALLGMGLDGCILLWYIMV